MKYNMKLILLLYMLMLLFLPKRLYAEDTFKAQTMCAAPTNQAEILWIDRIEDLPEYAEALYQWLVDSSTAYGALVDLNQAEQSSVGYSYTVRTIIDTVIIPLNSVSDVHGRIYEVIDEICKRNFTETSAYIDGAFYAFEYDHPEVFWLENVIWRSWTSQWNYQIEDGQCLVTYTQNISLDLETDEYHIKSREYQELDKLREDMETFENILSEVVSACQNLSDYEKIRYFNGWLMQRNQYNTAEDFDAVPRSSRTAVSAILGRSDKEGPHMFRLCQSV